MHILFGCTEIAYVKQMSHDSLMVDSLGIWLNEQKFGRDATKAIPLHAEGNIKGHCLPQGRLDSTAKNTELLIYSFAVYFNTKQTEHSD